VWRGIPLDLDEKLNLGAATSAVTWHLERLAARFNIRLPTWEKSD
jgi:hypothetical protein